MCFWKEPAMNLGPHSVKLEPLQAERLGRLRAEWREREAVSALARREAEIAHKAFIEELEAVCRAHDLHGEIELVLPEGILKLQES